MIGSMIATSTTCPLPVASAVRRAAVTAKLVAKAAMPSAKPNGGSVGGPSGSPVIAANPLIASAIDPNPGCRAIGPNCPKAVTRAMTRRGLAACNSAGPMPHRSSVPGRKFSISTSDRAASRSNRSAPSGRDRLIVTVRLLRPSVFHHSPTPSLGPVGAGGVRLGRMLDLHHLGTEVAEERRRQRPSEQRRRVDHPHARERAVARHRRSHRRISPGDAQSLPQSSSKSARRLQSQARRKPIDGERSMPRPASSSLALNSGGRGPPSKYHSDSAA